MKIFILGQYIGQGNTSYGYSAKNQHGIRQNSILHMPIILSYFFTELRNILVLMNLENFQVHPLVYS
jgi:hypothetical protein